MQDGEQQVLFVYFGCSLYSGFEHGQLQDVAGFLVEHEVCSVYRHVDLILSHTLFQFVLHRLQVHVESAEEVDHRTILASEHAQQEVLGPYAPTRQSGCFLAREGKNLRDFW